jgi:acylglycerol lipase
VQPVTMVTTVTPTSKMVPINDTELCVHTWLPSSEENNDTVSSSSAAAGVVLLFHGFLAHGMYPTVRYAAEFLVAHQYIVVAADARGHGQSAGLKGYLPSRDCVIADGVAVTKYVQEHYVETASNENKKLFLVGSSMGGTIALSVAQTLREQATGSDTPVESTKSGGIAGIVLLAPMLKLSVGAPARSLLWALSFVIPTWSIIPSSGSKNAELQYRDAIKRQECIDATVQNKSKDEGDKICVASASTCVELASNVPVDVTTPFLVLVADEDVVVNNQGSFDLFEKSPLKEPDKRMIRYPALHGLLCEPSPLIDTIQADVLNWMRSRN